MAPFIAWFRACTAQSQALGAQYGNFAYHFGGFTRARVSAPARLPGEEHPDASEQPTRGAHRRRKTHTYVFVRIGGLLWCWAHVGAIFWMWNRLHNRGLELPLLQAHCHQIRLRPQRHDTSARRMLFYWCPSDADTQDNISEIYLSH